MTETLSIRLDSATKRRLDALSRQSKRSKSFLAAEAIAAYVEQEEWQLGEIHAAVGELDAGQAVSHEKVAAWLKSWGTDGETKTSTMNVVWSPRAIRHLVAIRKYIEKDSDGNAATIAGRILDAVD